MAKLRDENGRFVKGHGGVKGSGRPSLEKERAYVQSLRSAITPDDIAAIAVKIKDYVLNESLSPSLIKLVFEYLIEKPAQHKILSIVDETGEAQLITLLQKLNQRGIDVNTFLYQTNQALDDNEQLQ